MEGPDNILAAQIRGRNSVVVMLGVGEVGIVRHVQDGPHQSVSWSRRQLRSGTSSLQDRYMWTARSMLFVLKHTTLSSSLRLLAPRKKPCSVSHRDQLPAE
nr:hypothetical protein CFP56_00195 [Quercus suber]